MARGRAAKTVKFTLEFERPSKEQILAVACDFCKADAGLKCRRRGWGNPNTFTTMPGFHHSRIGTALELKVVVRGELYRLPG